MKTQHLTLLRRKTKNISLTIIVPDALTLGIQRWTSSIETVALIVCTCSSIFLVGIKRALSSLSGTVLFDIALTCLRSASSASPFELWSSEGKYYIIRSHSKEQIKNAKTRLTCAYICRDPIQNKLFGYYCNMFLFKLMSFAQQVG